jgi:hypothetical protein
MPRFNAPRTRPAVTSPVTTAAAPAGVTHEGAPGFARDPKSELFLLAVSNLGGLRFYDRKPEQNALQVTPRRQVELARAAPRLTGIPWQETPAEQRMTELVRQVAASDPAWLAKFVPWLRDSAGMRSASVVAAAETAKGLLAAGQPGGRTVVATALQRADEPGELLAYWTSRYGRAIPKPVKRGTADAAQRLFTEYTLLKYDTASHGFRFGDVIELVHPDAAGLWQGELYGYALDRRHGRDKPVPQLLGMVAANQRLRAEAGEDVSVLLDGERLRAAGMTWEDVLSLAGPRVDKKRLWTALVPLLGYFALVRNLRSIDQAGVSDEVAAQAAARIANPEQVRRSRLFPFRFLAAYRAAPSLRWGHALELALTASLANVPALSGRTLILVDRSGSMFGGVSEKSGLNRADTAALFGTALAVRAEYADLVEFGTTSAPVQLQRGEPVLKAVGRFGNLGGTYTAEAVRRHYRDGFHTRVVIVTDEQAAGVAPLSLIPGRIPVYTWNLAGYEFGHGPSGEGSLHTFGGLTDHSFSLVPMLEAGQNADWDTLFGTA